MDLPRPITVQRGISKVECGDTNFTFAPEPVIERYVDEAELVISHDGIGSVMLAAASARPLIVMPRSADLGEAVDDHQRAFAEELAMMGIAAVVKNADELRGAVSRRTEPGPEQVPTQSQLLTDLSDYLRASVSAGHLPEGGTRGVQRTAVGNPSRRG